MYASFSIKDINTCFVPPAGTDMWAWTRTNNACSSPALKLPVSLANHSIVTYVFRHVTKIVAKGFMLCQYVLCAALFTSTI